MDPAKVRKIFLPLLCMILCACCSLAAAASSEKVEIVVSSGESASASKTEAEDTAVWSNFSDLQKQIMVRESDENRAGQYNVHILTKEDLAAAFGNFPHYLETASSLLKKLNGFSSADPASVPEIKIGSGYMIVRPCWHSFEQQISDMIEGYQGDWSVYVKDLSSGRVMEVNEHSMESASLIKLYIAGAVYEQLDLGNLNETDTIMTSLNQMITVSDNESSNVLVRAMCNESGDFQSGLAKVNDFNARHGFVNTRQVNGIADPSLWVSDGINMTSTADCGRLLEMVYNRSLVSHYNSFRFETLLNRQEVNYKIPAGLPESVHISHKTGEVSDTENDAAIIYTPYGDYIFCIMSTDLTDTGSAVDHIHSVTAQVYDYFTGHVISVDTQDDKLTEYLPEKPYIIYEKADAETSGE